MPVDLVVELVDSVTAIEELGEDYVIDIPIMDVETPFALLKAEKDSLVIAGYASPYIVDKENHRIELSALRPALAKFMKNKAYRNCQLLHSNITVGRVVDSAVDSKGRSWTTHVDDRGLFAVALIDRGDLEVGAKVIEKIRDGTLDSWSIGGRALASKYVCENKQCFYSIQELELYELTLCQQGKNPAAKFEILKADGLSYGSLMDQGTAEVKFSGKEIGEEIQLADVLKFFGKPIMLLREFVSLVGGLPSRGATKGDVDLLIKKDHEEMIDIPIQFRIIRAIDPSLWDRIHWSYDTFHGPFTNFVPLYDLWLVPSERSGEVIRMAEEPEPEPGQGLGVGKPRQGMGGRVICVCPECGLKVEKDRGVSCTSLKCPECDSQMVGFSSEPDVDKSSEIKADLTKLQDAVLELAAVPGQGLGVGKPSQGAGGRIICVCPECGLKVNKDRGRPCTSLKCPECDSPLVGFPLEKSSSIYQIPESDWSSCGDDGNSDRD